MHPLAEILTPERTICHAPGGSKKRLFETITRVITDDQPNLPYSDVFSQLIARERLGSTGLGKGIAIPHCRSAGCTVALGTLLTLEEAIAFDAPDGEPVDLLFALLVPDEAQQQHLDILAGIAGLFSQDAFCAQLRDAGSDAALFDVATSWAP